MTSIGRMTPARTGSSSRDRPDRSGTKHTPSRELAARAVEVMLERKARDLTVMDLRGVDGAVADFFVNATGGSDRQVRAVANAVMERIEEAADERPWHEEGLDHLRWVLLDYVDVVVHVFSEERRAYYDLERLWGDARIETVPEDASAEAVQVLQKETEEAEEAEEEQPALEESS